MKLITNSLPENINESKESNEPMKENSFLSKGSNCRGLLFGIFGFNVVRSQLRRQFNRIEVSQFDSDGDVAILRMLKQLAVLLG